MRNLSVLAACLGVLLIVAGSPGEARPGPQSALQPTARPAVDIPPPAIAHPPAAVVSTSVDEASTEDLTEVVQRYCVRCHDERRKRGNLSLEEFAVDQAPEKAEVVEQMIKKLRLGMMPPPEARERPAPDTVQLLAQTLETLVDDAARDRPSPGRRGFQRLNRPEYARAVEDLLELRIRPEAYLPPDTYSDNFDNIADVQTPSATVMNAYLTAASEISRLAVGDLKATSTQTAYSVPRTTSQWHHIEGTPRGTRGGLSTLHTFPADGEYVFKASYYTTLTGNFFGRWARGEQLEVSIDGERVAMIEVDRFLNQADPTAEWRESEPVFVTAGQHRVAAAFVKTFDGPTEDIVAPIRESLADLQVGYADGMTHLPHLWELVVAGPERITGVSETPTRRKIFTCRPLSPAEERPCAERILGRLASEAYRRPATEGDLRLLMGLYTTGAADGGFEIGIRTALQGILSSPDFLFRLEEAPSDARPGESYRIEDVDLASRLSFFLWALPPDDELLRLAEEGELSDEDVLEEQVLRLLRDPRAEALSTRFATQWLRLQDVGKVFPDSDGWPDFDATLRDDMVRETQLLFHSLVREDRSVLDLLAADYTYLNESLAEHYGIPGVAGDRFRRVPLTDARRHGVLGQGSVLVQTSHGNRTSPVLRGKWVMEVLLDSPPPPPPPAVPDLDETDGVEDGRILTVKERLAMHRANPSCNSCHQYIDPLGIALENFDVTGEWRIRDSGNPIDPSGSLWDGTPLHGPDDLRNALLERKTAFMRAFTANLMAYALGRRVEYYDQPTIRAIVRDAADDDYRISSFVLGVARSDGFQRKVFPARAANTDRNSEHDE